MATARVAKAWLADAERHPVRASALVAWVVLLLSSVALHPAALWARQGTSSERPLLRQRWAFFTRDPAASLTYVASAPRGQTLDRRHREEVAELRSLQRQLPREAEPTPVVLHGRRGMLICGRHLVVVKTDLESLAAHRRPSFQQPVFISC